MIDLAKKVPVAIKDCGAVYGDVKKFEEALAAISSPWSFAIHVGKDILINGVDIYHNIKSMINDGKREDYFNFGVDIGKILEEVLIGNKQYQFLR